MQPGQSLRKCQLFLVPFLTLQSIAGRMHDAQHQGASLEEWCQSTYGGSSQDFPNPLRTSRLLQQEKTQKVGASFAPRAIFKVAVGFGFPLAITCSDVSGAVKTRWNVHRAPRHKRNRAQFPSAPSPVPNSRKRCCSKQGFPQPQGDRAAHHKSLISPLFYASGNTWPGDRTWQH